MHGHASKEGCIRQRAQVICSLKAVRKAVTKANGRSRSRRLIAWMKPRTGAAAFVRQSAPRWHHRHDDRTA